MANEAYHSSEYYKQNRRMLVNGDPRALICFCIDVSKSMGEWWIQEGGLVKDLGESFSDGHTVRHFSFDDVLPGYEYYQKIDKLNQVLQKLLNELKADKELNDQVAVSIVVYSRFGRVICDFIDCDELELDKCRCSVEQAETAMGDGLRTALNQIDGMEAELRYEGKDSYTPLLIFMTDGTPTDDPRPEFAIIRERVSNGELHVFPLGIGDKADMVRLRDMFPVGRVPMGYETRYKMVRPADYESIFREIKSHVKEKHRIMVSEGDSVQSRPAMEDESVSNNQMGESLFDQLIRLA